MRRTICYCDICGCEVPRLHSYKVPILTALYVDEYKCYSETKYTKAVEQEVEICERCEKEIASYISIGMRMPDKLQSRFFENLNDKRNNS